MATYGVSEARGKSGKCYRGISLTLTYAHLPSLMITYQTYCSTYRANLLRLWLPSVLQLSFCSSACILDIQLDYLNQFLKHMYMLLLWLLSHLQYFSWCLPSLHGSDTRTKYWQAACCLLPYLELALVFCHTLSMAATCCLHCQCLWQLLVLQVVFAHCA